MLDSTALQRLILPLLAIALLVSACLSVIVYMSRSDPAGFDPERLPCSLGPTARALDAIAAKQMSAALAILNGTDLPPAQRLAGFRDRLTDAEQLLIQGLATQPRHAGALSRLAAVRWELHPPTGPEERHNLVELLDLASSMAPRVPRVQRQLTELLLRMGRRSEALAYSARLLEIDPGSGGTIVALLWSHDFTAEEILEALPPSPVALAALARPFMNGQAEAAYLDRLDVYLDSARRDDITPSLLRAYGDASLRTDSPQRLIDRMQRLSEDLTRAQQAEAKHQRSRAELAVGRLNAALELAIQAQTLAPESHRIAQHSGNVRLRSGDAIGAISDYRVALSILARTSADPTLRARLYSKIGQAEEQRGEVVRALDAYRLSLQLVPDERIALARLGVLSGRTGAKVP